MNNSLNKRHEDDALDAIKSISNVIATLNNKNLNEQVKGLDTNIKNLEETTKYSSNLIKGLVDQLEEAFKKLLEMQTKYNKQKDQKH